MVVVVARTAVLARARTTAITHRSVLCLALTFTVFGLYFSSYKISQRLSTTNPHEILFALFVQNFVQQQSPTNASSFDHFLVVGTRSVMNPFVEKSSQRETSPAISWNTTSIQPTDLSERPQESTTIVFNNNTPKRFRRQRQHKQQLATTTTTNSSSSRPFDIAQFEQYGCLKHEPMVVNVSEVVMNQSSTILLEMTMRDGCGPLRRSWTHNPTWSPMANAIAQQQSNCSLPVMTYAMDNVHGLASYITLWSRAMCFSMQRKGRLRSFNPRWLWMDQTHCDLETAKRSPWLCYFPTLEYLCEPTEPVATNDKRRMMMIPDNMPCRYTDYSRKGVAEFRSATIEYMFRNLSPLVIQEAQRQSGVVFGPQGAPEDLITVHLRWGDKHMEMNLVPIQKYIDAVWQFLEQELGRSRKDPTTTANIFLATEDPVALEAFVTAAPTNWNIYRDVVIDELGRFRPSTSFNCASMMAKNTLGRGGLVNMGSLLLSMEANYFVLTTASGFSRVMNNIRTNIIDPRCGKCTRMIDLQYANWN